MGVDIEIYAHAKVSEKELEAINAKFKEHFQIEFEGYPCITQGIDQYSEEHEHFIKVESLMRYYGPGYERGNWPVIYAMIRMMQSLLPEDVIYYGADQGSYDVECSKENLDSLWNHWTSENWNDYRKN